MIAPSETSEHYVDHVLGSKGLLCRSFPGFENRPEQLEMARCVNRAFSGNRHLAVEAGTGVGKSFAYLVAAIEQAVGSGHKVLVSTFTITLQQQLIEKDIPVLQNLLDKPFTACLAKGKQNYLCLRRLAYAAKRKGSLFDDTGGQFLRISAWAKVTTDGSLSDLDFVPSAHVWDAVKSEHGNCQGRKCASFRDCFYRKARRKLDTADLIVANHALFLSDRILKQQTTGILPVYDYVVLDEAHNLEHVAEEQLGISLSNLGVTYFLHNLFNPRTRKGFLAFRNDLAESQQLITACHDACKVFFAQVQAWYDHTKEETAGRCDAHFVHDNLSEPLRQLRLHLNKQLKGVEDADEKSEFSRHVDRCRDLELQVQEFLEQSNPGNIHWVEVSRGRRKRILLRSAPLNVGPDLKRLLFDSLDSVILTSATLTCDERGSHEGFEFYAGRIGLDTFDALKLGSPFDYENQVTLYVEADLPGPNEKSFIESACKAIRKYLHQSEGRAFVLFTSYSMLKKMAGKLEGWLANHEMDLLVQGSGIDRSVLLDSFRRDSRSVLFGTDSFWQGVDVPGDALSNVIIVRLPFAVPNHPLVQGRIEQLRAQGHNPFYTYQLPSAVIKFKQGFGRLIRTKTDRGIVVVLDSRIVRKNYGRLFLNAIPLTRVEIVTDQDGSDL